MTPSDPYATKNFSTQANNPEHTIFDPDMHNQPGGVAYQDKTVLVSDMKQQDEDIPGAWLIFTSQGPRYGDIIRITARSFTIGRSSDCNIALDDATTSRQHAKIRIEGTGQATRFMLHDLATDNGTFVNNVRHISVELSNSDTIRIGKTELTFKRI